MRPGTGYSEANDGLHFNVNSRSDTAWRGRTMNELLREIEHS